jgi:hypothetical protein
MGWKEVVEVIGRDNEDEKHMHVRNVIRKAAQKVGLTYATVISRIHIYSERNNERRHHGGAMDLLQAGEFGEWLKKLGMDEKELEAATPQSAPQTIGHSPKRNHQIPP